MVVFLDLDGFKLVNDTLGHAAGDVLLVEVGRRLASNVRPGDTIARLGGDEFLVLCDDVTGDADLGRITDRLRSALLEPVLVDGQRVAVSASIGASRVEANSTADSLVHQADQAM